MLLAESLLGSSSAAEPAFIEDVFSTWLYTGTGSTQTITNGIDLATRGGLVWMKSRSAATDHALYDTARGATFDLASNTTAAQTTQSTGLTGFLANGFSIGSLAKINTNAATYASWTFREQAKFFDVVSYTGNGANRTIAHNLGSVPGCIIVKRTDATADWQVYHANTTALQYLVLNSTATAASSTTRWNNTDPTSTVFSLGTDATVNANGGTYVAYLFANDAGGFGATGTDNVISCGGYLGNGSATGPVMTLGYEPQWLLIKRATGGTGDWNLVDNMRGFPVGASDAELNPNLTAAESTGTFVAPTATGFQLTTTDAGYNANGGFYVYVAIRRGPMRTPTTGTSVFQPVARTGTSALTTINAGFTVDLGLTRQRAGTSYPWEMLDRLRGRNTILLPYSASAEYVDRTAADPEMAFDTQNGVIVGSWDSINSSALTYINYFFRRAPGFFDVVCYTGNSTAGRAVTHNLGVAPEFLIVKRRTGSSDSWYCYAQPLGNTADLILNSTRGSATADNIWNSTSPTATTFTLNSYDAINGSGFTYVAYLFASCPGVSKVGSYTGTGATQVINCGFAAGARFVLIKRTDNTGDWYVWDSARGIVAGNDPYLTLNTANAEVTNTDWVDTAASGFELSNAGGNLVNTNGASYIFLAIA